MAAEGERPHVDAQVLTETELVVYEAIATLEQAGRPPTQGEIASASALDHADVGRTLRGLRDRGVVVAAGDGQEAFTLARHDWSSVPDTPAT
jgi:DNA-binding MarR family transcriptional regulator